MKKVLLSSLLLGLSVASFAQNRIGIEFGTSFPTFSGRNDNQQLGATQSVDIKPSVGAWYLRKIDRHVYLGAELGLSAYSFFYSKTNNNGTVNSPKVQINHNSSFFTVAPMVDFGLGRHQYIHLFIDMNMGFLTSTNQETREYADADDLVPVSVYNSQNTVSKFIFRPGFGLKQHFPLSKMWHVTFKEGFSILATDLTHLGNGNDEAIHPGYVTLQMGVMRKFHRPRHVAVREAE